MPAGRALGAGRGSVERDEGAIQRGVEWLQRLHDVIAYAAVYLASDEATFVHGSVIDVDGGRTGVAVIAS
jgi:NAD(P)-dependent dehydrogenase (short-subunit alcohol dehydrogenase family)